MSLLVPCEDFFHFYALNVSYIESLTGRVDTEVPLGLEDIAPEGIPVFDFSLMLADGKTVTQDDEDNLLSSGFSSALVYGIDSMDPEIPLAERVDTLVAALLDSWMATPPSKVRDAYRDVNAALDALGVALLNDFSRFAKAKIADIVVTDTVVAVTYVGETETDIGASTMLERIIDEKCSRTSASAALRHVTKHRILAPSEEQTS